MNKQIDETSLIVDEAPRKKRLLPPCIGCIPVPAKLAIAFFVAALVPAMAAVFVLDERAVVDNIEHAHTLLETRAEEKETLLASHIESLQRVAAGVAKTPALHEFLTAIAENDFEAAERAGKFAEDSVHAMQEQVWGQTHHIFLTDATGTVVLSPPHGEYEVGCRFPLEVDEMGRARLGTHLGLSIGESESFKRALQGPSVSSFFGFEERDHYHQLVMHPVRDEAGQTLGVVAVEIAIDAAVALLSESFTLGESGRIYLATPDGAVVVNKKNDRGGKVATAGLDDAITTRSKQLGSYKLESGVEVFGIYNPSVIYPWLICIEIDNDEIMQPIRKQHAEAIALVVAIAGVLGAVGTAIGLWFGMPLRKLSEDTQRIAGGDLNALVRVTRPADEIGRLQAAVESMRQKLKEHIHTLDGQITQRTADLAEQNDVMIETQERFELAISGSRDAIFDWEIETGEVFYAERWAELLGIDSEHMYPSIDFLYSRIIAKDLSVFLDDITEFIENGYGHFETEFRMMSDTGEPVWVLFRAAAVRNKTGHARRISGSLADISDIKNAQQELVLAAETDRLTGLPNRAVLQRQLNHALARCKRSGDTCAVLFFDFDRFKVINDSLGHDVGDALLLSIASKFRENLREVDTPSRFGGDEFVILLDDVQSIENAELVAQKLLQLFAEPHDLDGHRVVSTASIGLVTSEYGYESAEEMIRDADAAMYQAKANGRGCVVKFDESMHKQALNRLWIEEALRSAVENDEFILRYQPIVHLDSGTITGAEALIRWEHPERGLIRPDEFIYIAEDTGLIVPIGMWVIDEACRQLSQWKNTKLIQDGFAMSVNVSKRQLLDENFQRNLLEIVGVHCIAPSQLKLEVTETTVVDNRAGLIPILQDLRDAGFRVVMDDFGTGHSSLSGLHTLPIDEMKIDQSFIRPSDSNRNLIAITSAIVGLADHLKLSTVGEGIETAEHLALLQTLGCNFGQGYYFSRPIAPSEFIEIISQSFGNREAA